MRKTAVHLLGYLHSAFWLTAASGLSLAICLSALIWPSRPLAADWRQFRGDDRNGIAPEAASSTTATPPHHWSATENVAWKTALPGRGTSSPIVVAGRVFVTCSSGPRQDHLHLLALDADSGQIVWQRQFLATGRTICHPMTAVAAPTPASDGRRVVAYFSSNDLVAFDTDGNLLWMRGLTLEHPQSGNDVGMASSPLIADNTVIVQVECQGDSFAAGFDLSTGAQRWQIARPKRANWSSPTLLRGAVDHNADDHGAADHAAADAAGHANDLLLLQSPTGLSAHDPTTGREVWSYKASCNEIASTVTAHDTIYLPTDGGIQALRVTTGAATSEKGSVAPLWTAAKLNFGAASPLVDGGRVYAVNRAGVLNCGDAASGTILWQLRLKGAIWGSPAIASGHMYLVNKDGVGLVVRLPRKELDSKEHESGELVGEGAIDEPVLASPAIADGALYIRSDRHLWKIAAHGRH